jgi:hypothetical protein
MTAALAQARADQATAARVTAGKQLKQLLRADGVRFPRGLAIEDMAHARSVEARIEHPACPPNLAHAYSAFRRAQSAERKAASTAHRARLDADAKPAAAPKTKVRRKRPEDRHRELAHALVDMRREAVAA